jgi:hypothetical protein
MPHLCDVQEKRLISRFFDEISQDTGKFVFSVKVGFGVIRVLDVWWVWVWVGAGAGVFIY